jgi:hypothetical protein
MRIDEALRIAPYARKPISIRPDFRTGRPEVEYWIVADQRGYFGGDPTGWTIRYADMVPRSQAAGQDIERYLYGGADDWEPYPSRTRYVIDFRSRIVVKRTRLKGFDNKVRFL